MFNKITLRLITFFIFSLLFFLQKMHLAETIAILLCPLILSCHGSNRNWKGLENEKDTLTENIVDPMLFMENDYTISDTPLQSPLHSLLFKLRDKQDRKRENQMVLQANLEASLDNLLDDINREITDSIHMKLDLLQSHKRFQEYIANQYSDSDNAERMSINNDLVSIAERLRKQRYLNEELYNDDALKTPDSLGDYSTTNDQFSRNSDNSYRDDWISAERFDNTLDYENTQLNDIVESPKKRQSLLWKLRQGNAGTIPKAQPNTSCSHYDPNTHRYTTCVTSRSRNFDFGG